MKSGILDLHPLIKYVDEGDRVGKSLCGYSSSGREYGTLANDLTVSIPEDPGFYLWGSYAKNRLWKNIYLGKAGYGRMTHLRARILEELKDERQFLWCPFLTDEALFAKGKECYPRMWETYKNHWKRAIAKAGASHIIWASAPEVENSQVLDIEKDLIETMNPSANLKRPVPPSSLQPVTKEVIGFFRYEIHKNR